MEFQFIYKPAFIIQEGFTAGEQRNLILTGGQRLIRTQGNGATIHSSDAAAGNVADMFCWQNYYASGKKCC